MVGVDEVGRSRDERKLGEREGREDVQPKKLEGKRNWKRRMKWRMRTKAYL